MAGQNKLTALKIKAAIPGDKLQDGGGLILNRTESGGKWIFRYSFSGRRREMGLGSMPDVTLADVRRARARWAAVLQNGLDPISERQRIKAEEVASLNRDDPTLAEMIDTVFEARKGQLRGDGTRGRWLSPLRVHVIPKIGARRMSTIHQRDIHDVLAPIWRTKHETADKALYRLRIVFKQARYMGHDVDPFICDAARHMLGHHDHEETPIAATPWQDVPALFERIAGAHPSHLALRWSILTATRGMSARGAQFDEIDGAVWTVPADRIKGKRGKVRDFRVPLSRAALDVLEQCRAQARNDFLFPSPRIGYVSVQALTKVLDRLGEAGRPHGFRTSFRSWIQDTNAAPFDVAETALAHIVGSKIERSYARSDLLDQRRALMERWGRFVTGEAAGDVVQLHR
ncbi:MAG: integrase arm-type DNA-binding domain-containing protein [Roseovarius sp.]